MRAFAIPTPTNLATAIVVALLFVACGRAARPGVPPRNLVLVTFEALRADHTSFLVHSRPTTAIASAENERFEQRATGLDDLAAAGVVFARCFAPSPSTTASLASLLTGRSPLEAGVTADGDVLPADVPSLAELCAARGFATAAFVSAPRLQLQATFGRGFETFTAADDDAAALSAAQQWMTRDFGDDRGFFLWIHLAGTEPPWIRRTLDPDAEALVQGKQFEDPRYTGPIDGSTATFARVASGEIVLAEADRAQISALYDREIARATAQLALFLRRAFDYFQSSAEASEVWARTVFVFTSPSGIELGEEGVVGHAGTLHESVLHVPLFVRHPDSLTGERVIGQVVELMDIVPTAIEWLDLPAPERVQGRSLLPLVDSYVHRPFASRPAIAGLGDRVFSARNERFHLVWNPLHSKPKGRASSAGEIRDMALYEPERDRLERDDVSAAHPDVVAELESTIRAWRDAHLGYPPEQKPRPAPPRDPRR